MMMIGRGRGCNKGGVLLLLTLVVWDGVPGIDREHAFPRSLHLRIQK